MLNFLKTVDRPILYLLVGCMGLVIFKVDSFELNNRDTQIVMRSQAIDQSVEVLLVRLEQLESANRELVKAARNNKPLQPKIEQVNEVLSDSNQIAEEVRSQQAEIRASY